MEEKLEFFREQGWTRKENERWSFTTAGFLVSNVLIGELLDVQAQQNAVGTPYLQEVLEGLHRQQLPMNEEQAFMQELFGTKS